MDFPQPDAAEDRHRGGKGLLETLENRLVPFGIPVGDSIEFNLGFQPSGDWMGNRMGVGRWQGQWGTTLPGFGSRAANFARLGSSQLGGLGSCRRQEGEFGDNVAGLG